MSLNPVSGNRDPVRLGILLSGRGSNFLAIARSIREGRLKGVEIAVVVSNVAEAGGLKAARELGLPNEVFLSEGRKRQEHDVEVIDCLRAHRVDPVSYTHLELQRQFPLGGRRRLLPPRTGR